MQREKAAAPLSLTGRVAVQPDAAAPGVAVRTVNTPARRGVGGGGPLADGRDQLQRDVVELAAVEAAAEGEQLPASDLPAAGESSVILLTPPLHYY